jgi:hypothetical protein
MDNPEKLATRRRQTNHNTKCDGHHHVQTNTNNKVNKTWALLHYHSPLITGFVTRLTRRMPLVEQELRTLPEHPSSPPAFSRVRVTRSLVLYVCFVDRCLSFCTFSFGHRVVCSFSIYGFWLPLWYLQTLLTNKIKNTGRDVTPLQYIICVNSVN